MSVILSFNLKFPMKYILEIVKPPISLKQFFTKHNATPLKLCPYSLQHNQTGFITIVFPVLQIFNQRGLTFPVLQSQRFAVAQWDIKAISPSPASDDTLWGCGLIVLILSSFLISFTTLLCSVQSRHSPVAKIPRRTSTCAVLSSCRLRAKTDLLVSQCSVFFHAECRTA